jgi:putative oxidoreductase
MTTSPAARFLGGIADLADFLQAPFALATRIYVGYVFFWSGYLKIRYWEQTVALFESEYRVPLLSPLPAAIAGTFGELFFPVFLVLGLGGRLPALGLFTVNLVAVVSYWHVFSEDTGIAGLRQHELWGFMLAMLFIYGPGKWSLDTLLKNRKR